MKEVTEIDKAIINARTYLHSVGIEDPDGILLRTLQEATINAAVSDVHNRFVSYDLHSLLLAITRFISIKSQELQGPVGPSNPPPSMSSDLLSAPPNLPLVTPSVNNPVPPVESQVVGNSQEVEIPVVEKFQEGASLTVLKTAAGPRLTIAPDAALEIIRGSRGWRLRDKASKKLVSVDKILSGEVRYKGVIVG